MSLSNTDPRSRIPQISCAASSLRSAERGAASTPDASGTTKQGIGPVGLAIDPYWVSYFRRMYGDKIFQDDQFVEFLKKRGEWFHVPETGTKIQVGYSAPSNSRFRKTYGRNV
jgi:hypothetical protein